MKQETEIKTLWKHRLRNRKWNRKLWRTACLLACMASFQALQCLPLCAMPMSAAETTAAAADTAITFSELNRESVFLKQSEARTCTLTSCTVMLRRAAMLSGNEKWEQITESSVRKKAWLEEAGLKWDFTVSGIQVVHKELLSTDELIRMLKEHPEGIVIYNTKLPHAVLVTDYTDGFFYCSDPSNDKPSGRYPISKASITAESADRCWYVKKPANLTVAKPAPNYGTAPDYEKVPDYESAPPNYEAAPDYESAPDYEAGNLKYRILDTALMTAACTGLVKDAAKVNIPGSVILDNKEYQVISIAENAFAKCTKLKKVMIGENITSIGEKAFYQCKKLKTVFVNTLYLQEIGKDAFARIKKEAQILIRLENQMEAFALLLSGASVPKTVSIGVQNMQTTV